jgi:plasmid stabilization system protein ParE
MYVIWRCRAREDLELAQRYIEQHDPGAATRIGERILAAAVTLATAPQIGRPGGVDETRELVVPHTPFILAYAVIDGEIVILDVVHGAQEWPDAF